MCAKCLGAKRRAPEFTSSHEALVRSARCFFLSEVASAGEGGNRAAFPETAAP